MQTISKIMLEIFPGNEEIFQSKEYEELIKTDEQLHIKMETLKQEIYDKRNDVKAVEHLFNILKMIENDRKTKVHSFVFGMRQKLHTNKEEEK